MRQKPQLTITTIGRTRFWGSLLIGGIASVLLFLFFLFGWESLRLATAFNTDLLRFSGMLRPIYTAFLAAIALTLGSTITTHMWLAAVPRSTQRLHLHCRLGFAQIWGQFWVVLWVIAQFSIIVYLSLFVLHGYTNQLDFFHHYWVLMLLLPVVVFVHQWSMLRLVYRVGHWFWVALGIMGLSVGLFTVSAPLNPTHLNQAYAAQYRTEYAYIDSVCTVAHDVYGITIADSTQTVLREWYTPRALKQINAIQRSFRHSEPVSLDTILLADMVMHNLKMPESPFYQPASLEQWPYVWPDDILRQMELHRSNEPAIKLLLRLFQTQVHLVNAPGNHGFIGANYASRRGRIAQFGIPDSVLSRIRAVREIIVSASWFTQYGIRLSQIQPPEPWGRKTYEITLPHKYH